MMAVRPVVAALDPHRDDAGAARLGLLLARLTGAPLLLVSAYMADASTERMPPEFVEAIRAKPLARIEWQRRRLLGGSVEISSTVIADESSPARAIHRLAERRDASMIVVGSSARGQVGRMLPGAVTDRLLHGAPCPVAVAPTGFSGDRLELIGVAFVERPDGRAALAQGCELARAAGALVRVLTVRERPEWHYTSVLEPSQLAAIDRARDEEAERVMHAGLGAVPHSRSAGGEVLSGSRDRALAAASSDLDQLVCGSRGYGPVKTVLLGGVSHALVRQAACPVLVVPLAEMATAEAPDGRLRVARTGG